MIRARERKKGKYKGKKKAHCISFAKIYKHVIFKILKNLQKNPQTNKYKDTKSTYKNSFISVYRQIKIRKLKIPLIVVSET